MNNGIVQKPVWLVLWQFLPDTSLFYDQCQVQEIKKIYCRRNPQIFLKDQSTVTASLRIPFI